MPADMRARLGPLELPAGPGRERVRLVSRNPERVGQVGAFEIVPQAQLDDLPLARVQPGDRGPDQVA